MSLSLTPRAQRAQRLSVELLGKPIRHSFDAVLQVNLTKINQESEALSAQAKLGEELLAGDGGEGLDGFQFNDQRFAHQKVRSKTFFKEKFVVANRNWHLPSNYDSALGEFVRKHRFVDRLQQTGPESRVNREGRIKHGFGQRIFIHSTSIVEDPGALTTPTFAPFASLA